MSGQEQGRPAVSSFVDLGAGVQMSVIPADESLATSFDSSLRRVAEDHVRIDVPRRRGDRLDARVGDSLTLVVTVRGHSHLYTTTVRTDANRDAEELELNLPVPFVHSERREMYRILVSLTARSAAIVDSEGRELARLLDLRLLDLSGGGAQLTTRSKLEAGDRIRFVLPLPGEMPPSDEVKVIAEIVSVDPPDQRRSRYRAHAHFVDVDRTVEEGIVRFVYREQRLLQRGRAA